MATGSEVSLALEAQDSLRVSGVGVRVVSMPCLELFAEQPQSYRDAVLPPEIKARIAIEAAHPMSWYQWVGEQGEVIGIERFGASAPYARIYEEFGITAAHLVERARRLLG